MKGVKDVVRGVIADAETGCDGVCPSWAELRNDQGDEVVGCGEGDSAEAWHKRKA